MPTLQAQIAAAKEALLQAAPGLVEQQAQTQLALVTLRIQSQGLGAYHYASGDYPLYWFKDREINAAGKAWYEKKEKRQDKERATDPANWGGFRAAQGLPADAVYLTYTSRMFRSLTTQQAGSSGTVYTAHLVASEEEGANKVKWNMGRYGDFLAPLPAEAAEVAQVGQQGLQNVLNEYFPPQT